MAMTPEQIEAVAVKAATTAAQEAVRSAALEAARAVSMSSEDFQHLVAETVKQTLIQLGIDHSNPIEMQQDFQHLRSWRKAGQELRSKGLVAALGIFLTGTVSLILLGLKDWFSK